MTEAVNRIDATLDAELQLRHAYIVTPKRLQMDHLLKTPKALFREGVFPKLPLICQFDFQEACKCIAFALPTAAAFHCMRGVEGVLRRLYCGVVRRDRIEPLLWHSMVMHLRKRRSTIPKPLLDNLDNIRSNFRNPTSHPDARFDIDEAQDLFSLAVDVVNRVVKCPEFSR
jgi:hypothetical protein